MTGSKSQCRKVWTSYGIAMQLFSFLQPREVCQDQLLNRFFYDIAICRVQTRFKLIRPQHLLTYQKKSNLEHTVIGYKWDEGVSYLSTAESKFYWYSCQMNHNTILQVQVTNYGNSCRTLQVTSDSPNELTEQFMPEYPGMPRSWPCFCRTSERHAFLIGGLGGANTRLSTCLRFDLM